MKITNFISNFFKKSQKDNKIPFEVRNAEIRRLRFKNGWQLERIAKKFGITRERVRQILGDTGGRHFLREYREKFIRNNQTMTNKEIANSLKMPISYVKQKKSKLHLYDLSDCDKEGWKTRHTGMLLVIDELKKHFGSVVPMSTGCDFDVLVDGHTRVLVKSASRGFFPSQKNINPLYRFHLMSKRALKRNYQIVILVITETKDFFVIPKGLVPKSNSIQFCWPSSYNSRMKTYHNNWDVFKLFGPAFADLETQYLFCQE